MLRSSVPSRSAGQPVGRRRDPLVERLGASRGDRLGERAGELVRLALEERGERLPGEVPLVEEEERLARAGLRPSGFVASPLMPGASEGRRASSSSSVAGRVRAGTRTPSEREDVEREVARRRDSLDARAPRARAPCARSRPPVVVPDDHLRDHRVVVRRDLGSVVDRRVDADAGPERRPEARRRCPAPAAKPRDGSSALIRISIACPRRGARPASASGSPAAIRTCSRTMSMPGDELGDRVLDLEPAVHLDEVELARRGRGGTRTCPRSR